MEQTIPVRYSVRYFTEILTLAIIYFVSAKIGQLISVPPGNVTPLWIPSGIILAAVLLRGYWLWPGICLGAFAGNVSAYIDFDSYQNILSSLFSGSMNATGDALGVLLGAYLIRKFTHTQNPMHESSHIVYFLLYGVLLNSAISASFGVTSLAIAGFIPWSDYSLTWSIWCIGDGVGILMFTPLLLSYFNSNKSSLKRHRRVELVIYALTLGLSVLACLQFFDLTFSDQLPLFLVVPILIWSVLRLCELVTFMSIIVVSFTTVFATAMGIGPFSATQSVNSLLELQIFIAATSITIFILNAVVRERQQINTQLKNTHRDLEKIVEQRTRNLKDALQREQNLNKGLEDKTRELDLTQKQLLHSQKMESLGTLAGGIAHDFNNILNVIIGNAELANNRLPDTDPVHKNIQTILNSSTRAADLVKQILSFSRIKTENFKNICMSDVVKDAVKMARSVIPANIRINYNSNNENIVIYGDETQIHQVILNLCTNAYHSIDNDEGEINIDLSVTDSCPGDISSATSKCAILTINDNGGGIPESILDRIFDPFFTTKEVGKGTGLGLSVVHTIIDSHKGMIKADSEVGAGTRFEIYFPVSTASIEASDSAEPGDTKTNININKSATVAENHTIMVIDDENDILGLYQQYLQSQNYNVIAYSDPSQALKAFEENHKTIDVVITDQSMPEITGKELSRTMLSIKNTTKIILTTGYSDMIDDELAREIGICKFLDKPVKLADLKSAIDDCLHTIA